MTNPGVCVSNIGEKFPISDSKVNNVLNIVKEASEKSGTDACLSIYGLLPNEQKDGARLSKCFYFIVREEIKN